jgi:hypothetical protein
VTEEGEGLGSNFGCVLLIARLFVMHRSVIPSSYEAMCAFHKVPKRNEYWALY